MALFSNDQLNEHDSTAGTIIRLNAGFVAAILFIIVLRLYIRSRLVRRVGSDDSTTSPSSVRCSKLTIVVLMVFAALFTIGLCAMCIVGTRFGLGQHEWNLDPTTVIDDSKNIIKVLYVTAVSLTKASIIASYLRVLPTPIFRRLMYATAVTILALWVCSFFITIFQCDPVEGAWDFTLQSKKCLPILKFFYVQSSVNIATDLILCISPMPLFWKLNISVNERVILCMLFGTGLFATIASIIRLSQLHDLASLDISYSCVSSLNWSVVEVGIGIICVSVPSLKPIINRLFPGKLFTTTGGSSRWTPSGQPAAAQISERDGYELEPGSHPQRIKASQMAKLDSGGRVPVTISKAISTRESDEERLV